MNLDQFRVDDLHAPNGENIVLFVLESPHKDEFSHGHPIAGQAGKRLLSLLHKAGMTFENSSDMPLGCQIKNGNIENIGVMNASQIPLDASFYCDRDSDTVRQLVLIKQRLQKTTQKNYLPKDGIELKMYNDFTARLKGSVSDSTQVIIPLGHLASNFVKSAKGIYRPVSYGVNHPSSRKWNSTENVNTLRLALSPLIANQSSRPPWTAAD